MKPNKYKLNKTSTEQQMEGKMNCILLLAILPIAQNDFPENWKKITIVKHDCPLAIMFPEKKWGLSDGAGCRMAQRLITGQCECINNTKTEQT